MVRDRPFQLAIGVIYVFASLTSDVAAQTPSELGASASFSIEECSIFYTETQRCDPTAPESFLPVNVESTVKENRPSPPLDGLAIMLDAMKVMQTSYFAPWLGTWPGAIDWTAAVMGTHISGAIRTLSEALMLIRSDRDLTVDWKLKSNLIDDYFTQLTGYYFGQDAFAIRNEAYDDILWVVLGWLETVQFINTHTGLHYEMSTQGRRTASMGNGVPDVGTILSNQTYLGNAWIPAFSHRARIFWDLATHGWDTELCGGGMVWNPRLLPYKNAITNELFIAASISMYLYFPGDDNQSPFYTEPDTLNPEDPDARIYSGPRDAKYLKAAVDGYRWLVSSNMTNARGLYADGFHISGYSDGGNNNTKCDQRSNAVYSYNQGVLLTGQRGLWEATGAPSFLDDGHKLIQNVIVATGYDLNSDAAIDDISKLPFGRLPPWRGLGRAGVMEDTCDASGTCSQDGQTFKGIFFHHLTAFCAPLSATGLRSGISVNPRAFISTKDSHDEACLSYGGWLKHNARAAVGTRDKNGRFGQWWTAGLLDNWTGPWPTMADDGVPREVQEADYRNYGVPNDTVWRGLPPDLETPLPIAELPLQPAPGQNPLNGPTNHVLTWELKKRQQTTNTGDPNQRGRGRTVETQGGGLALLRAYWKIAQMT